MNKKGFNPLLFLPILTGITIIFLLFSLYLIFFGDTQTSNDIKIDSPKMYKVKFQNYVLPNEIFMQCINSTLVIKDNAIVCEKISSGKLVISNSEVPMFFDDEARDRYMRGCKINVSTGKEVCERMK